MSGTDFFDDDLVRQRERATRLRMGPADEPVAGPIDNSSLPAAPRPVADLNLTRMAKHKKDIDDQASIALQELEQLRKRQEKIEGEKRHLEDMRRRHEDFERGRREMTDHLKRSLANLERQEADAQRMTELYNVTRTRFKELLGSIEAINEEAWPDDQIRDELGKALGLIEDARMEYNKASARVEAARTGAPEAAASKSALLFDGAGVDDEEDRDFTYWFKVGLAVSLPIIVTLALILIIVIVGRQNAWF